MLIDLTKVKERIAKMLAKASNNTNEHEAASAAVMARKLMDKYQIDEMDIASSTDGRMFGADQFGESSSDDTYRYMPQWKNFMSVGVGKFNDCQTISEWEGEAKGFRVTWRGFKEDAKVAKQMYDYLCAVVDSCTSAYMRSQGYTRYNARVGTVFKEAMAGRVTSRLRAMEEERMEGAVTATGTSLVVLKSTAIADYFGSVEYESSKSKKKELKDDEIAAIIAGRDAGDAAAITDVLEEQS